jgi:hypothetical protein
MWARIRNTDTERNKCYKHVKICKAWASFEQFYLDMGEAPEGYSLDRIDNGKGYNKDNCRWVPLAAQATNTSRNVVIEFNGVTTHISKHARAQGLAPDIVFDRINKLGWGADRALSTPKLAQGSRKHISKNGGTARIINEHNLGELKKALDDY